MKMWSTLYAIMMSMKTEDFETIEKQPAVSILRENRMPRITFSLSKFIALHCLWNQFDRPTYFCGHLVSISVLVRGLCMLNLVTERRGDKRLNLSKAEAHPIFTSCLRREKLLVFKLWVDRKTSSRPTFLKMGQTWMSMGSKQYINYVWQKLTAI